MRRQGAELRERERECGEREREAEDARRRAREAEERADSLEPRVRAAERESKVRASFSFSEKPGKVLHFAKSIVEGMWQYIYKGVIRAKHKKQTFFHWAPIV